MNIQDGMNIVDVLAIMPYYVSLFLITDDLSPGKKEEGGGMHMQILVENFMNTHRILYFQLIVRGALFQKCPKYPVFLYWSLEFLNNLHMKSRNRVGIGL
jgi:hypothetical protein